MAKEVGILRNQELVQVACVFVDDPSGKNTGGSPFSALYVLRLAKMVNRFLLLPHRFVAYCDWKSRSVLESAVDFFTKLGALRDHRNPGKNIEIEVVELMNPYEEKISFRDAFFHWPGWWSKINMFSPHKERLFYLDLDTIIVGRIDNL